MYARVTTFEVYPSRLSDLSTKIKEIVAAAKSLPGIVDVYVAWRFDATASSPRFTTAKPRRTPLPLKSRPYGEPPLVCCLAFPGPKCTRASNTSAVENPHLARMEKGFASLVAKIQNTDDRMERCFAAVAEDIAETKREIALHAQVTAIETDLRDMKNAKPKTRVGDLEEQVFGTHRSKHPKHVPF